MCFRDPPLAHYNTRPITADTGPPYLKIISYVPAV